MSDRTLLVTTTGEPIQPACLHYSVRDLQRLETCFRKLRCMSFDNVRNGWVWHYDEEARSLEFEHSWEEVSKHGPVVLGSFYIRGAKAAELYVRSIERALMAVEFFDEHVPRTVARVNDMDVANRLFSAEERALTPETLFADAETDFRQQVVEREALWANPQQMMAEFQRQFSGEERKQLPELERIPTNFYEDGIESLKHTLILRQHLAMAHWTGNHDLTLVDLIQQSVTRQTKSGMTNLPTTSELTRINWDFGPEVPVRDFFESLDLSRPADLTEAVENFIRGMEKDEFRTWEAFIREEQGLYTMPILVDLTDEPMSFEPAIIDPVCYLDDMERCNEPWYELLRRIAPRLLIERLRTGDVLDEVFLDGWPRIAAWVVLRARGLSLPEGVRRPLDVVPAETRHRLWLQFCCEPLCGLGQAGELTLANEEEHRRIDEFLDLMHQHRDSVEFLGLTLDGLLDRCELPDRDRPIFIRMVSDRLGLSGTDDLLAPKLEPAAESLDEQEEPGEPIERLSNEEIRQAVLHPEPVVRRAAISYLTDLESGDPSIAPLFLDSIQTMEDERDRKYAWICLRELAQTEATSERILRELKPLRSGDEESDYYRDTVAQTLLAADPSFLASNQEEIFAAMSGCDPTLPEDLEARISDRKLDVDERWNTFVELVHRHRVPIDLDDFYPRREFVERVHSLIRGMGGDERPVRWVMEILPLTINDEEYSSGRELIAVSLSGVLGLTEAIPYLVAVLHDDDREMIEYAVRSLSRIDGDAVIEALDRCFAGAEECFQLQAAVILQHIPTERGIRTLQNWSRDAEDESVQCRVRQSLLELFVTSEIDRTRQWMIDTKPTCEKASGLRRALVANALIAGRDFSELDDWLATVREDLASEPLIDDSWYDDEWTDGEELDDDDVISGAPFTGPHAGRFAANPARDRDLSPMFEPRAEPVIKREQKVGRNEPCPCGSGKKYKKCCMRKR